MMVSVEIRSSERVRPSGYVTAWMWRIKPPHSVPKLLDDAEAELALQARRDGAAITIRAEET